MNDFISTEEIDNKSFYNECNYKIDNYLSKEELLAIINNTNFTKVKSAYLELISGCIIDGKTNDFKILTKNIRID